MEDNRPDIQLIANLVVICGADVLLVQRDDHPAWWLPGDDLTAYEHPDAAAARVLAGLGLAGTPVLSHIESFRGRRGWHVMFNYRVTVPDGARARSAPGWHRADALPRTAHGGWERDVVTRALAG